MMFDVFKNRLELTGTLTTVTALRISKGRSSEPIGSDLPVIKDALGRPFIPGSSFKGALRSRLESFLRAIDPQLAIEPSELTGSTWIRWLKDQKQTATNDADLTVALIDQTDLVSCLFGAPWIAGKLQIRDLTVISDAWFGQYQERDGVCLDRDTGTAAEGKLYDFQVVPAGTPFEFKAVVENAEELELGLLIIGLHQLETEQIPLGGGRSRGLGVVRLEISEVCWIDPQDNPQELLTYLQRLINDEKDNHYKLIPERFEEYKTTWTEALINHLRTKISSSTPVNS
nr:CRISPR-associated RAMP protein Csx7 [Roseofilum acuticapitatum]